ncbi:LIME1 protein, partial [Odontophorus gujanensis]|nr:LIME1 protein [Odontophorus gujanensis]
MAVTHGEELPGPPPLVAVAALALLGGLVYLCTLCAACQRHGRRKKIPPDGVKLVDESLLRQTQLRSLSKSDTRLHELYRLKARDSNQRPASLDFPPSSLLPDSLHSSVLLHRQLPQIPGPEPPAPDQTYSNLLFAPAHRSPPDTLYECLAVGEDDAPTATGTPVSPPWVGQGAADYACVRKVKKTVPEEQEGAVVGPSAAPRCWEGAGNAPCQ